MSTETSIGPDAERGGNENHGNADGCGNKTLGDKATQQPPAGAEVLEQAGTGLPAGVPGAKPRPGAADKAAGVFPDGPNVEASPWELDAARGKLPPDR
jgi:hypothetical protein